MIILGFFGEGFADNLFRNLVVGMAPILILVVGFTIALRFAGKPSKHQLETEKMLEENEAANMARLKEIGQELFYVVNAEDLPMREYSDEDMSRPHPAYMWQNRVAGIADKKMLRFDQQYSNVQLKHMFGVANLEFVARYEENFTNFNHALRHWAEALIAAEQPDDARRVLEVSARSGSEISQTYTLLADIYAQQGNADGLEELKSLVEQSTLPGKNIVKQHLSSLSI
ncbi:MAG: hypothetical protein FWC67_03295 [Defluviitaleaceae bacterium]|nr:hypothetical protein [Defluviitaleaceae bacterium]